MHTFSETGLNPKILESIDKLGYTKPTPIQAEVIPFLLNNKQDLIARAQTGTGKTAAFGLPILHNIDHAIEDIQSIVLCPTRELCLQIARDIKSYAKGMGIKVVAVYGGASISEQISAIRKKCHIVVGTPGRVNDLINRRSLDLSMIRFLVLDEADEMLNMGFKEEMDEILHHLPRLKQTMLFSATIPHDIKQIAGEHMSQPHTISVSKQNSTNNDISHKYCICSPSDSYQALRRIIDIKQDIYGIVFCRTRLETRNIAAKLINDGYNVDALHGDLTQAQRDIVMDRFRSGQLQLLLATDVAARGLDVDDLSHVIHYHLPDYYENYIHRSGRTGRAGKKGISIAIITPTEARRLLFLEKQTGLKFEHYIIPSGKEIIKKRLSIYLDKILQYDSDSINPEYYENHITTELEKLSKEELIKRILALQFQKLQNDYNNAPDLNREQRKKSKKQTSNKDRKANRRNFSTYRINVGSKNNLKPDVLIGIINKYTPERKIAIGKIDIKNKISFFEAERQNEEYLIKRFRKARFNGMPLLLQPTGNKYRRKEQTKKVRYQKTE